MNWALEGVKVIDLTGYIAGSYAAMMLADLGAEVIKVESLEGDSFRELPGFFGWNRGKRSISVNLQEGDGLAIVHRLATRADVLMDNMRPGGADRLGVGEADLRAINPRLIYCSGTAFGIEGPDRDRPGFDPLLQAMPGVMALQRLGGPPPPVAQPARSAGGPDPRPRGDLQDQTVRRVARASDVPRHPVRAGADPQGIHGRPLRRPPRHGAPLRAPRSRSPDAHGTADLAPGLHLEHARRGGRPSPRCRRVDVQLHGERRDPPERGEESPLLGDEPLRAQERQGRLLPRVLRLGGGVPSARLQAGESGQSPGAPHTGLDAVRVLRSPLQAPESHLRQERRRDRGAPPRGRTAAPRGRRARRGARPGGAGRDPAGMPASPGRTHGGARRWPREGGGARSSPPRPLGRAPRPLHGSARRQAAQDHPLDAHGPPAAGGGGGGVSPGAAARAAPPPGSPASSAARAPLPR